MRETITLTTDECNQILELLQREVPIKYLAVYQAVQTFFDQRLRAAEDGAADDPAAT